MTEYLSPHFSLDEMTVTSHREIDNTPPASVLVNLTHTAHRMEAVRDLLGKPIHVNSAYRCPKLNKAVGSKSTSAHLIGYAVDFICPGFGSPLDICRAIASSDLEFDQLIFEGTWVHISFDPRQRRQQLTMHKGRYTLGF